MTRGGTLFPPEYFAVPNSGFSNIGHLTRVQNPNFPSHWPSAPHVIWLVVLFRANPSGQLKWISGIWAELRKAFHFVVPFAFFFHRLVDSRLPSSFRIHRLISESARQTDPCRPQPSQHNAPGILKLKIYVRNRWLCAECRDSAKKASKYPVFQMTPVW